MKRTIEIEDKLCERVESAKEETTDAIIEYIRENELTEPETQEELEDLIEDIDCLETNDIFDKVNYSGRIDEIIDGCVPVYTYDIKTAFFLHGNKLEEAYENSGIGDNPLENNGMTAIYCYISQELYNGMDEVIAEAKQEIIEELREDNKSLPAGAGE